MGSQRAGHNWATNSFRKLYALYTCGGVRHGGHLKFTIRMGKVFKVFSQLVTQACLTICDPMDCSMPGFPVHHQLPGFAQTHVHWVGDAIQPFHPLSSPSPPAFNLSQHQRLFKWVSSSHQVAKVLEFHIQHLFFQWIFRTNLLRMDWLDLLEVQGTLKFQFNKEFYI